MINRNFNAYIINEDEINHLDLSWKSSSLKATVEQAITEDQIDELCIYLENSNHINILNLTDHIFSEASLIKVISATTASQLIINATNMDTAGWAALANNYSLKTINLGCSELTDEKLIDLLHAFTLAKNVVIQELILESNKITDKGAIALAEFCKTHPLKLNLINNFIGEQGIRALLKVTKKMEIIPQDASKIDNFHSVISFDQLELLTKPDKDSYQQWLKERKAGLNLNITSLQNLSLYAAKNVVKDILEPPLVPPEHLAKNKGIFAVMPSTLTTHLKEIVVTDIGITKSALK